MIRSSAAFLVCLAAVSAAGAQPQSPPQRPDWAPMPPPVAGPEPKPWPGTVALRVDATDLDHHVFAVHETLPVTAEEAADLTLLFPRWLPGTHSPSGPLGKLAGLVIQSGGERVEWSRDAVDMSAFHVAVPKGATTLDLKFQFLSPLSEREGRVVMTPAMLNLQWNAVVLYPAGHDSAGITVAPSVTVPAGWHVATALEAQSTSGATTAFKPVGLNTLVDSPIFAGRHHKEIDLDAPGPAPVHLNLFADEPRDLDAPPAAIEAHKALVREAYAAFGSHHYDHYDFLLALTDQMSEIGLEHHRSSENALHAAYFRDWASTPARRDLLPHEYTHSWNGKFRRPSDLWAPNFNVPERDSLLWVYEGQTQYWGQVLAARSGIMSAAQARDYLALTAAEMDAVSGRSWRSLQDTTDEAIISGYQRSPWIDWARSADYYPEGVLLWLDVDTWIREHSDGRKSLDDFARAFLGVDDGSFRTVTYGFDDIVAALNAVQPNDWAKFLRDRLDGHGPGAPLNGLTQGGYRLVYTEDKGEFLPSAEKLRKRTDLFFSIGLRLGKSGEVQGVRWDSPAFKAGLAPGAEIVAVNGVALLENDDLVRAVGDAKGGHDPIELIVKQDRRVRTVRIDYHDGVRYPHLERIADTPARLDDILAAHAAAPK